MTKIKENIERTERMEQEAVLEYLQLGRGHIPEKTKIAKGIGLSLKQLRYRADKFKNGQGVGRKTRKDKNIPKKDPQTSVKLKFFAKLATGVSVDQATKDLELTEHQGNMLAQEFKQVDKFKAIRNAPQLETLKDLISDLFHLDMAIIDATMHGSFNVKLKEAALTIPVDVINDLKNILAYCMQRDEFAKLDPKFKNFTKDNIEDIRVDYAKQELLEKKDYTSYSRLRRSTKGADPTKQMDLKIVYAIIDRYAPGLDEQAKIRIIQEEFEKLKI